MRVLLFGASGMVGQGALRECMLDPDGEWVVAIGRSTSAGRDSKLREVVHTDFLDSSSIEGELTAFDACFFCLGVSSAGMREQDYWRITHEFTLSAARVLVRLNPNMTFIYVSGMGTDSSEQGRSMWARVKGKTENDLRARPCRAAYMFRPGMIMPMHGIKSRTKLYSMVYVVMRPLLPLLSALFPKYVTTTEQLGQAMLKVAKHGYPKRVLETSDIQEV